MRNNQHISVWTFLLLTAISTVSAEAGSVSSSTIINLPVNQLQLDTGRNLLYASVPSRAGVGVGNTITRIGLASKSILDSTFIGSEPDAMTLSSDGSQLYVDISGAFKIGEFDPATLTAGPQAGIANNYMIGALASVPGDASTFVGSVLRAGSPKYVGIGVWHFDGTNFTTPGPVGVAATTLAYSDNPSTFYAASGGALAKVTLGPGDALGAVYGGAGLGGTDIPIAFGQGLVVSSHGRATDVASFTPAGLFSGTDLATGVALDAIAHKAYFINQQTISIFDTTTFVPIDTLTIPAVGTAKAFDLTRFGDHGLAFFTDSDKVFLIESNSIGVPKPSTITLVAFGFAGLMASGWQRRKR